MTPTELSPIVLQGLYQRFTSFDSVLSQFFSPVPNPVVGNKITYDLLDFRQDMARATPRHAPAPKMRMPTRGQVYIQAPTYKQQIEPEIVSLLDSRAAGSLSESAREQMIANAIRQIRLNHDRRQEWLRAQWLTGGAMLTDAGVVPGAANGTIYLDYPAVDSTEPLTVASGIDSDHITATVGASWAVAGTDIRGDLESARRTILQASGVDANLVLLNSTTMDYLYGNTAAMQSEFIMTQVARYGRLRELWGYEFLAYDRGFQVAPEMASTAGTAALFIPDNVVILTSRDNTACGRELIECSPSDLDAPQGSRGVYAWQDRDGQHPHHVQYGLEWTGTPAIKNINSMYVWTDVTAT